MPRPVGLLSRFLKRWTTTTLHLQCVRTYATKAARKYKMCVVPRQAYRTTWCTPSKLSTLPSRPAAAFPPIIAVSSRQCASLPIHHVTKAACKSASLFQHAVPLPEGLLRDSHSLELTFLGARRYYRGLYRDPLVVEGLKGWCTATSTTLFLHHHHHFTFSPFRIGAYTFPGHH